MSGITLDRTSALCIPEGTEEELKDKIRELANQLMFLKGELHSAKVEREDSCASKDAAVLLEDQCNKGSPRKGLVGTSEEEVELIKEEVRQQEEQARERLEAQLIEAKVVIADQEEKIRCLKHTTGMLVSDSSLGEEERKDLISSLSRAPEAAKKEDDEKESDKKGTDSETVEPANVAHQKTEMELEVEALRKEMSSVSIETYQNRLKLTQVNQELEQLDTQKQKVQQVVSGLEQKTASLRESMAEMELQVAEAKAEVKKLEKQRAGEIEKLQQLKKKQDEKHASLRGADELLSYEEMQQKVAKMERLVMVTSREKKDFQREISELKERVAVLEAGQP